MALWLLGAGVADETRPLVYDRPIVEADLAGRSLRELTLMRNWIFARAGNPFRRRWLNAYFRQFDWYRPAEQMDTAKLSALDLKNAATIGSYEAALSRDNLLDRAAHTADALELRLLSIHLGSWAGSTEPPADLSPLEDPSQLDRLLTVKALDDFSPRDLKLLLQTLWARRGKTFTDDLAGHFGKIDWYQPDAEYSDAKLTKLDRRNLKIIQSVQATVKQPEPLEPVAQTRKSKYLHRSERFYGWG